MSRMHLHRAGDKPSEWVTWCDTDGEIEGVCTSPYSDTFNCLGCAVAYLAYLRAVTRETEGKICDMCLGPRTYAEAYRYRLRGEWVPLWAVDLYDAIGESGRFAGEDFNPSLLQKWDGESFVQACGEPDPCRKRVEEEE